MSHKKHGSGIINYSFDPLNGVTLDPFNGVFPSSEPSLPLDSGALEYGSKVLRKVLFNIYKDQ
ncbi:MAG: hypothetical protein KKA81_03905 [Bacteroidetes bacterium]|nr:hypothetical protein [Bacteroidota bacterium]